MALPAAASQTADHVIHVSIDGLRPDIVAQLGAEHCPNLHRFIVSGVITMNARTDYDYTETLPGHACILTGRAVLGEDGHGVDFNSDTGGTVAGAHGSYVAGVFDVVHDSGMSTALYAGKSKFSLFDRSWDGTSGAPDTTGADDGRDKIDLYLYEWDTGTLFARWKADMSFLRWNYSFLHLRDPDSEGHAHGWTSRDYREAVMRCDRMLGEVFALVRADTALDGKTAVIVTSDHGGTGYSHGDPADPLNYTIPLFAAGPGIPAGTELYSLNDGVREDPGGGRPDYAASTQPVRNGGSANLALSLLGLGPVPGSTINPGRELAVHTPGGASDLPAVSLTSPTEGAEFDLYGPFSIEATAFHPSGIDRVEFYAGWTMISADSTGPYEASWQPAREGEFILAARAVPVSGPAGLDDVMVLVEQVTSAEDVGQPEMPGPSFFPNPVNGPVELSYDLPESGRVTLDIYDAAGRLAARPLDGFRDAGARTEVLTGLDLPSGVYFYRMKAAGLSAGGKLVVIR